MPQRKLLHQRNAWTPQIQKIFQNHAMSKSERTMSAQGFRLDLPILAKPLVHPQVLVQSFTMMRALIHRQYAHPWHQYLGVFHCFVRGQRIVTTALLGLVTWTWPSQPRQSRKPAVIINTIDLRGNSPWMSSSFSKGQRFSQMEIPKALVLLTLQPTFPGHFTYPPTWIRSHGEMDDSIDWLFICTYFHEVQHFNILLFNGFWI